MPRNNGAAHPPVHRAAVHRNRVGLTVKGRLPLAKWTEALRECARDYTTSRWQLGDLILFGEGAGYGKKYTEAEAATGLSYSRLSDLASVCRRFEISRRRQSLSFAHHADLVAFPDTEQDRFLDLAAKEGWSRSRLRQEIGREKEKIRLALAQPPAARAGAGAANLNTAPVPASRRPAGLIKTRPYRPQDHIPMTLAEQDEIGNRVDARQRWKDRRAGRGRRAARHRVTARKRTAPSEFRTGPRRCRETQAGDGGAGCRRRWKGSRQTESRRRRRDDGGPLSQAEADQVKFAGSRSRVQGRLSTPLLPSPARQSPQLCSFEIKPDSLWRQ
jgi:hypothetical protein